MPTSPHPGPTWLSDPADDALALLEGDRGTPSDDVPFDQDGDSVGAWHTPPATGSTATRATAGRLDHDGQVASPSEPVTWQATWSDRSSRIPTHEARVGTEYATSPGVPGRGVATVTTVALVLLAALDIALTGRLSYFFDCCFVVSCLVAALAVRRRELFAVAVLPPLALALVVAATAAVEPAALSASGGWWTVVLAGLAARADALLWGVAVALATLAARARARSRP